MLLTLCRFDRVFCLIVRISKHFIRKATLQTSFFFLHDDGTAMLAFLVQDGKRFIAYVRITTFKTRKTCVCLQLLNGKDNDFIEYQDADKQYYKANELKPSELLNIYTIDSHGHKVNPNK